MTVATLSKRAVVSLMPCRLCHSLQLGFLLVDLGLFLFIGFLHLLDTLRRFRHASTLDNTDLLASTNWFCRLVVLVVGISIPVLYAKTFNDFHDHLRLFVILDTAKHSVPVVHIFVWSKHDVELRAV